MSRGRLVTTPPLEESTVHYMLPSGARIASDVTPGAILKLNQARQEMKDTMSFIEDRTRTAVVRDQLIKTMSGGGDNSRGATDTTLDSPITPSGVPFTGGWQITARGRTLGQLLAEENVDKPSPSPAVTSGQGRDEDGNVDGDGDYAPSQAQGKDFDASVDNGEFDADEAASDLLNMFTGKDGRIRKQHAAPYFLTVSNDGSERSHYAVPLARMNKVSQQPEYSNDALDNAFAIASGRDNGMAVRALQNRVIRLKKRAGFDLTPEQTDYQERHMSAPSLYYDVAPSPEEIDNQLLKYDSQYMAALTSLQKAVRSK
jgi:hypothetical protein